MENCSTNRAYCSVPIVSREAFGIIDDRNHHLRPEYAAAVQEREQNDTRLEPLRREECNEVLLLHGTKPQVVLSILEKSLDPALARDGLFGRGTYFAEHLVKIDQYTTIDPSFCGSKRQDDKVRNESHQKIFPTRFKKSPDPGHHAIVAEIGGDIHHFREFAMFDKDAIKIEYLVAYTHSKHYCACGIPARRRTFHEHETGKERPFVCSDNPKSGEAGSSTGGCGLNSALPRCFCRQRPWGVDFLNAYADMGAGVHRCKFQQCSFSEPIQQEDAPPIYDSHSDDDLDDNRYDYDYGFLVKG